MHAFLQEKFRENPAFPRVLPFLVFAGLTTTQGWFGEGSRYWVYAAKTLVGVWLVWLVWPWVPEMRWRFSPQAIGVGVLVFVAWVGLDGHYPVWSGAPKDPNWVPLKTFGEESPVAWGLIGLRILGTTLVVPAIEEIFYRSFLYRYVAAADFEKVPLNHFSWKPMLVTAAIFGVVHPEQWLAGILCAVAYQMLVIRTNRLGDAMTAHAVTNLLLGLWVVWKGAWKFW